MCIVYLYCTCECKFIHVHVYSTSVVYTYAYIHVHTVLYNPNLLCIFLYIYIAAKYICIYIYKYICVYAHVYVCVLAASMCTSIIRAQCHTALLTFQFLCYAALSPSHWWESRDRGSWDLAGSNKNTSSAILCHLGTKWFRSLISKWYVRIILTMVLP